MKLRDLKRARHLGWRDIANKGGIFASFLLVTVLSLYAWSPARQSSAFDWTSVDGTSPYIASLSGNDEIRISATPSASQAVFDQDDVLELTSTCPYGAAIYLNMDSSESNALSRTGSDEGIKTISATTGTALNDNSWGYSLDDGSTYLPMPLSTGTPVNIYNSEQVESNTEITVKYGMKIDSSIPSGYYSGNVLYSIVTNPSCAKYTLTFDTDGGTPIEDVLLTYGQTIDLPDYTTTKDNYVFDGWELIGSVSTTYDGTETDVDVNPGNSLTVELKAKWTELGSTMQTFDARSLKNTGDSIQLIDERDGNTYTVKRLADGNVWMTENLRLGKDTTMTLTSADSDVSSDYQLPAKITTLSSSDFYTQNISNVYIDSTYGGYYSFYAATAGTGGTSLTSGEAPSSICPKGWRLPTGGISGEVKNLYSYYRSAELMRGDPGFILGGSVSKGERYNLDLVGPYWTSTIYNDERAYSLAVYYEAQVHVESYAHKFYGYGVRCVAINTMQNYKPYSLAVGNSEKLVDKRDGKYYTVRRLADDKVWMTENLRIIGKTITSKDSNIPVGESFTIPESDISDFTSTYNTSAAYIDSTYGGYYNFYTATAGWGVESVSSGNSPKDICPKGWRLPTGSSSGEFQVLYDNYGTPALMQDAPGFVRSGRVLNGSMGYSENGYYWSSSVSDSSGIYRFGLSDSVVTTNNVSNKYYGFSMRCIVNEPKYTISFDANGGTSVSDIETRRGKAVMLPSTTRSGYKFLGWYTERDGGVKITSDNINWTSDITLHAHWLQVSSTMQAFSCSSLTNTGDMIALRDTRDNEVYTVKKLADGKCWMTENLRLGKDTTMTLTSADSDVSSDYQLPAKITTLSSSDFYNTQNISNVYIDSTYGGYYNFYAATAGTGGTSLTSGEAPSSICPKGWRLPTSDSSGEFNDLYNEYNSVDLMLGEPGFVMSGRVYKGAITNYGWNGYGEYWASTIMNINLNYILYIASYKVFPAQRSSRDQGLAIRCIAR